MSDHIFILIPADIPSGPVKGAYALANSLVRYFDVTLVTLNRGLGSKSHINVLVRKICLSDYANNFFGKLSVYRDLLLKAGGRAHAVSFSLCLSADLLNTFCNRYASTFSSVRGNLFVNYLHDYGLLGVPVAFVHLFSLRRIENVIAMSNPMASQIHFLTRREPSIICNFIDESMYENVGLNSALSGEYRFLFLGSLSSRKQPAVILRALKEVRALGVDAFLCYVGTGPEITNMERLAKRLGLQDYIHIAGFVHNPETFIVRSDVLVLPSLSEGISRAAMEALFLGVPCVLRDVDANSELIIDGINGATFREVNDLPAAMLAAAEISRTNQSRHCLLPSQFRQAYASEQYANIIRARNCQC